MRMNSDTIIEIAIDDSGRLTIKPKTQKFAHIYRAATEVHWDSINERLYSPKPREWSYLQWYEQIVAAVVDEYGIRLSPSSRTKWVNVDSELKEAVLKSRIGLA